MICILMGSSLQKFGYVKIRVVTTILDNSKISELI